MSRHKPSYEFTPTLEAPLAPDNALFHNKKGEVVALPHAFAPLADTHGHLTSSHSIDAACAICRAALAGVRLLVVPIDPVDDLARGRWATARELLSWLDEVVEQAAVCLERCAQRGLEPPTFSEWSEVPSLLDAIYIVAGAHPYGAARLDKAALKELEVLLESPRCVGVGEIGIDFGPYNELGAEVQQEALEQQLRIAREHNLPVELHVRNAKDDSQRAAHALVAQVLEAQGVPSAGCDLHCFTENASTVHTFSRLGCHIAFGGAASFASSDEIRDAVAACPRDLLLSETDSPYMAPVPLRGQTCEPAMVAFNAACVAQVRSECLGETKQDTYTSLWKNACTFFGVGHM